MAHTVPKVFISATSADLRLMRGMVRDALIQTAGMCFQAGPPYREFDAVLRFELDGSHPNNRIVKRYGEGCLAAEMLLNEPRQRATETR